MFSTIWLHGPRRTASIDEVDIGTILDFLRWFADAHHQAKEETVLFPALKEAVPRRAAPSST